jgi:hypothetical protein
MTRDRLTHVGTGAILGLLSATTTALAGVAVAAVAGRGILAIAVPLVASNLVTSIAHKPANRLARTWSEDLVKGRNRPSQPQARSNVGAAAINKYPKIA